MRLTLTKSESLHHIKKKKISGIIIPDFIYFTKKKFKDNLNIIINRILKVYKQNNIKKMQMSNFLNFIIKLNYKIKIINTKSYWYEFDDFQDYKNFFKNEKNTF